MFFVVNKDKIMAFVVACCTVFVLFMMTSLFAKAPANTIETVETSQKTPTQTEKIEDEDDENTIENNEIKQKQ